MLSAANKRKITNNGWELLTTSIPYESTKVEVRCPKGHISRKAAATVMSGGTCLECRKEQKDFCVYVAELTPTIVKIGISKIHRVRDRLAEVNKGLKLALTIGYESERAARDTEKMLLELFSEPEYDPYFKGCKEFRLASVNQIKEIVNMIPTKQDLRALKEKHAITTAELARLVYVTEDSAYKWLSGSRQIDQARYELLLWKLEGIEPPRAEFINPHQKVLEI